MKKRTLANLSKLPRVPIDGIARLLEGGKVSSKGETWPDLKIVRSLRHGHVSAVRETIR